jgi:hypothetical protein
MANTGYKQAIIAYKVSKPGGEPLDVNGLLTSVSGRKQAIALLTGHVNPGPSKYEVEFYYNKDGTISGNPTITYDVEACPVGYIRITPTRIILEAPTLESAFVLESSSSWRVIGGPTNYVTLSLTAGGAGRYIITAEGITVGGGYYVFENVATLQRTTLYVAYVSGRPWVLETGYWNNLGFWYADGIWKY